MYLYHIVPPRVVGNEIVPLNELFYESPALCNQAKAKYAGREELMKVIIPPLKCCWADVIFLTAVHPSDLAKAYEEAGGSLRKTKFYQVDATKLNHERMAVLLYDVEDVKKCIFKPFSIHDLPDYRQVPAATRVYYMQKLSAGEQPFIFHRIPHILLKGKISILNLQVVDLS